MTQITRSLVAVLVLLIAVTSAKAEGFEGVIAMTMNVPQLGAQPMQMTINIKGQKTMTQMDMPGMGSAKIYADQVTGKIIFVMEAMKMGMEMPKPEPSSTQQTSALPVATGEKKEINGYYCEKYTSTSDGIQTDMWLTTKMPKTLTGAMNNAFQSAMAALSQGSSTNGATAYADLFSGGKLPVQVDVLRSGTVMATITYDKFEQKSLSDALFTVPSDISIQQMPAGMGGMGR